MPDIAKTGNIWHAPEGAAYHPREEHLVTELLAAPAGVTIRRLAGNIGAEITGVDAAAELSDESIAAVRQALLEYKVIFLRDQEINRVWQGGVEGRPTKRLGLRLTGNFDRSTGLGQLSGEPPAYGPVTWPLVTGTVYYDFRIVGRLAIDLQRTYYIEQIVPVNNYSANLLTIRWTKGF